MSNIQPNENQPPQEVSEQQAPSVTMEIQKQPRQSKKEKQPAYLDDHVNQYGQNLISSIATLINQSKEAEKPKRKKKTMTPEMLEQCRRNLAKGRETVRKRKEAQTKQPTRKPKSEPKEEPEAKTVTTVEPTPEPTPTPKVEETKPKEPENITMKLSDLFF